MASSWLGQRDNNGPYIATTGTQFLGPIITGSGSGSSGLSAWLGQRDPNGPYFNPFTNNTVVYLAGGSSRTLTPPQAVPSVVDFVTPASGYAYTAREFAPSQSDIPDGNFIPGTLAGSGQVINF